MLDAGDVDGVADRARDRRRRRRRRRPSARTRSRAGRRSRRSRGACVVGQVAGVVARRRGRRCARRRPAASAIARTSSIVGRRGVRDVDAASRAPPSARTISRPAPVRPPFSMPCAEPPNALSKKWLGDIIRKPASATTSTFAGSSSSAWAPSIARSPAVIGRLGRACAPRRRARSARDRMIGNRPSDRRGHRVGPGRQVERPGEQAPPRRGRPAERERQQDDVVAAVVVALDVQVPRRLRASRRGPGARRCPRCSRGTSTWPRSTRSSRSRPHSSESAWRSATERLVERRAPAEARTAARRVRQRRRSAARPWRGRRPGPATAAAPAARRERRAAHRGVVTRLRRRASASG